MSHVAPNAHAAPPSPPDLFHRVSGFLAGQVAHGIDACYARQSLRVELERLDYRERRDPGVDESASWRPSR